MSKKKEYIHAFISWIRYIFRTITFRSHKTLLAILRLFCRCVVVGSAEEGTIGEDGLAQSSQSLRQMKSPTSMALAIPSQDEGLQLDTSRQRPPGGSANNGADLDAQDVTTTLPTQLSIPQYPAIKLDPITPREVKRYDRIIHVEDRYEAYTIKKGLSNRVQELSSSWQALTHPEGALFFFYPDKRVFTDTDVRDPEIAAKVGRVAEKVYQEAHNEGVILSPHVELGLEFVGKDGDSETWGYYFADCADRDIFWFKDNKSDCLMSNVRGVKHISHVRYALESQYWKHIELFPNKHCLLEDDLVKVKGIVMHALADNITSDTSLAPFGLDAISNMLTLMDPLSSSIGKEHEHSVCIVARFMRLFCDSKFVNFCGQPGARLDADKPLYGDPSAHKKQMIYRLMNIVLFGSPGAHSKGIHRIWVDKIILQPRWKNFIDRLNSEWNGYTIFSTVMLAVDISFLAVPTVQNQTATIIPAYLSTLCAMGSLMVSLVLAGQVNDTRRNNAEGVASFMSQMSKSLLGLDSLAIMLSLPFALLIWGMIFFGIALSILIFYTHDKVIISITSPIFVVVVILATWPILASNNIHLSTLRERILELVMGGSHDLPR